MCNPVPPLRQHEPRPTYDGRDPLETEPELELTEPIDEIQSGLEYGVI